MTARLSSHTVRLLDLSSHGARIEHPIPFGVGNRRRLEFLCEGDRITIESEIVRSRLERNGGGAVFRTGLRFVECTEELWGLLAVLAITKIQE